MMDDYQCPSSNGNNTTRRSFLIFTEIILRQMT